MGQLLNTPSPGIIYTTVDRLTAPNAGSGLSAISQHVILFGENAGNNLTRSNIIAIGVDALKGGATGVTVANGEFSVVVGHNSLSTVTSFNALDSSAVAINGPNFAFGSKLYPLVPQMATSVLVGYNIAPVVASTSTLLGGNVMIGQRIMLTATTQTNGAVGENVIIGYEACRGTGAGDLSIKTNVIIGFRAALVSTTQNSNVVIGGRAAPTLTSGTFNVIVGCDAGGTLTSGQRNVLVGTTTTVGASGDGFNCVLGSDSTSQGSYNTMLGYGIAGIPTAAAGSVLIGAQVDGSELIVGVAGQFALEVKNGAAARRAMMYGQFASSSLILGHSSATNRNWRGTTNPTNAVKILNGSVGAGTNPTAGGYFYVVAGVLHWYDQNGNDSIISIETAGQLASFNASLTNNAAAAGGTLLNAPVAGNPTKWIPINDNGTIRNIPAW